MKKTFLITAFILTALTTMAQRGRYAKSYQEILNEKYTSGMFKGAEGTLFDIENENVQSYFNILDWLEGRVAGLQVFVTSSGIRVPVIRGTVATIFVDEIRMDPSFLNAFSVNDIGMIKVIKGPFAGAFGNGGGGTIAIYTIRADEEEFDLNSD
ncbi:MAG TPA: TonB-dependent receptor plug domain-containing protein [Chitinophagaceae bacterium]